jgi:hypothetical protein
MISSQASVWWFHGEGNSPRKRVFPSVRVLPFGCFRRPRRLTLRERSLPSNYICPRGNFRVRRSIHM